MTNIITTPSRALDVVLSDTADIPTPYLITSGVTTDDSVGELIDHNADFISDGVNVGDIVYVLDLEAFIIVGVTSTVLKFEGAPVIGEVSGYKIYQQSPMTGSQNQGCLLYVSCTVNAGSLMVTTAGNDVVIFRGLSSGVLPIRVKKAWSENRESIDDVIALW